MNLPRYFTSYWKNNVWRLNSSEEGRPLYHASGNGLRARGIRPGDYIYVVTVSKGLLYVLGRMEVATICGQAEAERRFNRTFVPVSEHLIGVEGTPMRFGLITPIALTRALRFVSKKAVNPKFLGQEQDRLDEQTLRVPRELTPASAKMLDRWIAVRQQPPA